MCLKHNNRPSSLFSSRLRWARGDHQPQTYCYESSPDGTRDINNHPSSSISMSLRVCQFKCLWCFSPGSNDTLLCSTHQDNIPGFKSPWPGFHLRLWRGGWRSRWWVWWCNQAAVIANHYPGRARRRHHGDNRFYQAIPRLPDRLEPHWMWCSTANHSCPRLHWAICGRWEGLTGSLFIAFRKWRTCIATCGKFVDESVSSTSPECWYTSFEDHCCTL